jgi:thioesterase domain-containing protein/acyl carrier protein
MQDPLSAGRIAAEPSLLRRADLGLKSPWEEPRSEAEQKLAKIWRDVLGIDAVGAADDFFELGGDSFAATALAAEIEAAFGVKFAPADIINFSTFAKQAPVVAGKTSRALGLPSHLVIARAEGSRLPLFVVHGALGFAFFNRTFVSEVGDDRPIYLFQAPGLDGRTEPRGSIEEIARLYVASILEIQPTGPYNIAALCTGSFIALEMCNLIQEAGQMIARLILLDPYPVPPSMYGIVAREKYKRRNEKANSRLGRLYRKGLKLFDFGSSTVDPGVAQFEEDVKRRTWSLQRLREEIQKRQGRKVSPEEAAYSPETMLKVTNALQDAFSKFVPRAYSGHAALLVNSGKVTKVVGAGSFWRSHLGDISYETCGSDHNDLFGAHLIEAARFVKGVLDSPAY